MIGSTGSGQLALLVPMPSWVLAWPWPQFLQMLVDFKVFQRSCASWHLLHTACSKFFCSM
eukprot:735099-Prorocentrum_lima.AAC.1